jgi:hypothetical protein
MITVSHAYEMFQNADHRLFNVMKTRVCVGARRGRALLRLRCARISMISIILLIDKGLILSGASLCCAELFE